MWQNLRFEKNITNLCDYVVCNNRIIWINLHIFWKPSLHKTQSSKQNKKQCQNVKQTFFAHDFFKWLWFSKLIECLTMAFMAWRTLRRLSETSSRRKILTFLFNRSASHYEVLKIKKTANQGELRWHIWPFARNFILMSAWGRSLSWVACGLQNGCFRLLL